jgi:soluble lytic murein transglycosylase-like protein
MLFILPQIANADEYCYDYAAQRYGAPKNLLVAISKVESSFNKKAVNKNKNGSIDVGVMQINSSHFADLSRRGIYPSDLFNPCINVSVGAWILSESIKRHGLTWRAVGAYNAGRGKNGNEADRKAYVKKVWTVYSKMNQKSERVAQN